MIAGIGIVSVSVFSEWSIDFAVGTSCYSCCCEDRYNCCIPCFDTAVGIVFAFVFSEWSIDFAVGTSCYSCCCEDRYNCCTPCFVGVRTIFSAMISISLLYYSVYKETFGHVAIAPCLAASVAVAIVSAVAATASVAVATVAVVAAVVCRRSL